MDRRRHTAWRAWMIGLVVGLAFGLASLIGGTVIWLLGLAAAVLLGFQPPRAARLGGLGIGFALSWQILLATADLRCGEGCVGPDLAPWLAMGWIALAVGLGLTTLAIVRRARAA